MSLLSRENFELIKQFILTEDLESKNKMLALIPPELQDKVISIQNHLDDNLDAKTIASKIGGIEFLDQLEGIQSLYYFEKNEIYERIFEKELKSALTHNERKELKKRFTETDNFDVNEFFEIEIRSALTVVERNFLKKKFFHLEQEIREEESIQSKSKEKVTGVKAPDSQADFTFEAGGTSKIMLSRFNSISIYLKYAAAACGLIFLGVGIYQVNYPSNIFYSPKIFISEENNQVGKVYSDIDASYPSASDFGPKDLTELVEVVQLEEVITTSEIYQVLTLSLGFVNRKEEITIVVSNHKERALSIQQAISIYSGKLKILQKSETEFKVDDLKSLIFSLRNELTELKNRESYYIFEDNLLTLFVSLSQLGTQIIRFEEAVYLKHNTKFFKLRVSKNPQPLIEETNSDVLEALDKIIFNAD